MSITMLPDEIVEIILNQADARALISAMNVNRQWRRIAKTIEVPKDKSLYMNVLPVAGAPFRNAKVIYSSGSMRAKLHDGNEENYRGAYGACIRATTIRNLAPFADVRVLTLSGIDNQDFSALYDTRFEILRFVNCDGLVDLSRFVADNLDVDYCENLAADLRIGDVDDFSLQIPFGTRRITTTAAMSSVSICSSDSTFAYICEGSVRNLQLFGCANVDLSSVVGCESARLSYCKQLTDISALKNMRNVLFEGCWNLEDLTPLAHTPIVEIIECASIADLTPLANAHEVNLVNCIRVVDFAPLRNVPTVSLVGLDNLRDVSYFANARELRIVHCENVTDISSLIRVEVLKIKFCNGITALPIFDGTRRLCIDGCTGLTRISDLGSVEDLAIKYCPDLQFETPNAKLQKFYMSNCGRCTIEELESVLDLNVD